MISGNDGIFAIYFFSFHPSSAALHQPVALHISPCLATELHRIVIRQLFGHLGSLNPTGSTKNGSQSDIVRSPSEFKAVQLGRTQN